MRKKIYLFILCIVFIGFHSYAQNYWLTEHEFYEEYEEVLAGAAEAHPENDPLDGGFLICGFGGFTRHISLLFRIDRYGNELWRKDINDLSIIPPYGAPKAAHYTDDGNFLVGGNFGLMKINSETGEEMWDSTGTLGAIHYIEKYNTNKFLIIQGEWHRCYTIEISNDIVNVLSSHDFGDNWQNFCAKLTTDNKFIFSGEWEKEENNYDLTLCRTDVDNLEFDNYFGNHG